MFFFLLPFMMGEGEMEADLVPSVRESTMNMKPLRPRGRAGSG